MVQNTGIIWVKLENSSSSDVKKLPVNDITSIQPVIDKFGKPVLLVNYYDWEFCMDASLFCDSVDIENKILDNLPVW